MKILAISLKNLASFAGEVTVDFRTAPLCHAGVFAIIGPTGAGKSTILDALCLALYGNTPRANEGNKAKIAVDDESALFADDPRHLMRRGASDAFAKVTFEAEGEVYTSIWRCRRATKGSRALQEAEYELRRGEEVIASKVKAVTAKVTALTGLDFDGFCRSVLLPQGRFERFLTCPSGERSELLEALTDPAGLYRGISQLAFARGGESDKRIKDAEAAVHAISVLADEVRAELETRMIAHDVELAATRVALHANDEARGRLAAIASAVAKREARQREAETAEAARLQAAPDRTTLDEAVAARPLRATARRRDEAVGHLRAAEQDVAALDARIADAADAERQADERRSLANESLAAAKSHLLSLRPQLEQDRALALSIRSVDDSLASTASLLADSEAAAKALAQQTTDQDARETLHRTAQATHDAWLSAHPEAALLAERRGFWDTALEEFATTRDALDVSRSELASLTAEASRRDAEATRTAVAREASARHAAEARAAADEASRRARLLRAEDPRGTRDALGQRATRLETLEVRLTQRRAERVERTKRVAEASDSEAERAGHEALLVTLAQDVERLEQSLAKADEELRIAALRASMEVHRASLVAGEPCIVCGSTVHPWAESGVVPKADDEARRTLEDALRTARAALRTCDAQHAEARERARAADVEARRIEARMADQLADLARLCGELGLSGNVDDDTHPAGVSALRAEFDAARRQLDAAVKAADDADAHERDATDERGRRDAALHEATQQAARATQRCDEARADMGILTSRIADAEGRIRDCAARAAEALSAIPGAEAAFRADPRGQRGAWAALADAFAEHERERERLTREANSLAVLRAELRNTQSNLDVQRARQEEQRQALERHRADLQRQRDALFAGRAAIDVEGEATRSVTEAETALADASSEQTAMSQRLASLRGQGQIAATHLESRRRDAEQYANEHDSLLASLALDESEARRRNEISDGELHALASRLENIEHAATSTAALLAEADHELRRAESLRPEGTDEELTGEHVALTEQWNTIQRAVGADRQALEQDGARRALRAEKEHELTLIREREGVWGQLARLLGNKEGDTFALYAQSLAFDALIAATNEQLARLQPRYALRRHEEAAPETPGKRTKTTTLLDMVIEDRELADAVRPISTLSGGERFLVSLALALGLSTLASQRRKLASMFIDEGFGTLDPETLGTALSVLDALQARGTRVGVISHVSELKERLQARVVVERRGDGTSTLRVEG